MPATTADRIRECRDAGDKINALMVQTLTAVMGVGEPPEDGSAGVVLQQLWDSAYEAGRQDAAL